MKKRISLLLCFFFIFVLAGCTQIKLEKDEVSSVEIGADFDVTMEVVAGSEKKDSLTICVKNNTDIEIDSGNEYDFSLEVWDDGKWYTIKSPVLENTTEALVFVGERNLDIEWSNIYGKLPNGKYRIVKYFCPWTEDGFYTYEDGFYLAAEFSID